MKYKFDGTIDGIFSCIFRSFINREIPTEITCTPTQLSLVDDVIEVKTDYKNNKRVINAFYKYCGYGPMCDLKYAFRSGEETKNIIIFNYLKKTFDCRKNISDKFSENVVMDYYELIKRISLEVHRMKGFLRFSEIENGILYAHFEPDNDIADLLIPHFADRFKNQPFVIHDVKRNKLALHYNGQIKVISPDFPITVTLGKNEENLNSLWKIYYDSVSIKERANHKLMASFMPTRYHKHLNEKSLKIG